MTLSGACKCLHDAKVGDTLTNDHVMAIGLLIIKIKRLATYLEKIESDLKNWHELEKDFEQTSHEKICDV